MTLTLFNVGYRYAGATRPSLLDISLDVPDGTVIGLAGASESGKSTLCLVAGGLAPRAIGGQIRGRIELNGTDIDGWPMHRVSTRIGTGFQDPGNQMSGVTETVFEEVAFGPMNHGLPHDEVLERTWAALATLGIEDLAPRDPRRLSGGQQQLVAIAGLMALRPDHLVLDEPTAQLDPAGTHLVGDALRRLAAAGASILIAEQKTDLLAEVAAEVVVLADGRIAMHGPAAEVLGDRRLEELGVAPPTAVSLAHALTDAGVPDERVRVALDG